MLVCYQLVRNWYEVIEAMGVLRSNVFLLVMLRALLARIINAIEKKKNYLGKD